LEQRLQSGNEEIKLSKEILIETWKREMSVLEKKGRKAGIKGNTPKKLTASRNFSEGLNL